MNKEHIEVLIKDLKLMIQETGRLSTSIEMKILSSFDKCHIPKSANKEFITEFNKNLKLSSEEVSKELSLQRRNQEALKNLIGKLYFDWVLEGKRQTSSLDSIKELLRELDLIGMKIRKVVNKEDKCLIDLLAEQSNVQKRLLECTWKV